MGGIDQEEANGACASETGVRPGWSAEMIEGLLAHRRLTVLLVGATTAHLALASAGVPAHRCPFHEVTGLPCPGCGLSRASLFLLEGRLGLMWRAHPFTPYFALLGILLAGAAFLPESLRRRWISFLVSMEVRTRMHAGFLLGFAMFGVARLLWSIARPV